MVVMHMRTDNYMILTDTDEWRRLNNALTPCLCVYEKKYADSLIRCTSNTPLGGAAGRTSANLTNL